MTQRSISLVRKEWDAGRHYYTDNSGDISGLLKTSSKPPRLNVVSVFYWGCVNSLSFPLRMTLSLSNMRLLENSCQCSSIGPSTGQGVSQAVPVGVEQHGHQCQTTRPGTARGSIISAIFGPRNNVADNQRHKAFCLV